jgi:hypothetical protein
VTQLPFTYDEAIARANQARASAVRRRDEITERVRAELKRGRRLTLNTSLRTLVDADVAKDPLWRTAVNDNQWFLTQATAYGLGEVRDALRELTTVMREIRDDQRAATATVGPTQDNNTDVEPGDRRRVV